MYFAKVPPKILQSINVDSSERSCSDSAAGKRINVQPFKNASQLSQKPEWLTSSSNEMNKAGSNNVFPKFQ